MLWSSKGCECFGESQRRGFPIANSDSLCAFDFDRPSPPFLANPRTDNDIQYAPPHSPDGPLAQLFNHLPPSPRAEKPTTTTTRPTPAAAAGRRSTPPWKKPPPASTSAGRTLQAVQKKSDGGKKREDKKGGAGTAKGTGSGELGLEAVEEDGEEEGSLENGSTSCVLHFSLSRHLSSENT